MTAIVGIAEEGRVWIGGDSAGVSGLRLICLRSDEKVFLNGPFLFGFASSFRMGQLLRYAFKPPEHPADVPTYQFMCTTFIDAIRECFKSGGYAHSDDKGSEQGGVFLVGYRGGLFEIHEDYQVGQTISGYAAVGCGDTFALGSLWTTRGVLPKRRIELALAAAEAHSPGVRGPFVVLDTMTDV